MHEKLLGTPTAGPTADLWSRRPAVPRLQMLQDLVSGDRAQAIRWRESKTCWWFDNKGFIGVINIKNDNNRGL